MKKHFTIAILLSFPIFSIAQNVGMGTNAPNASAKLDITDANRGLLIPRVALTATNAAGPIAAPATSLLVYNNATAGVAPNNVTPGFYYWDGAKWVRFASGNAGWDLLGNAGTVAGTNFLGTTDNVRLDLRTNNTIYGTLLTNGNFGLGTVAPSARLELSGADNPLRINMVGSSTTFGPELRLNSTAVGGRDFRIGSGQPSNTSGVGKLFFYDGGAGLDRMVIDATGNVGINTITPTTKLDVNGSIAWRENATTLALANGANNNVALGATAASTFRVSGPTAAFTLTGAATGNNGQILTIINPTTFVMTFAHDNAGSVAANRFYIPGLNDLQLTTQYASATFQYNTALSRWVLMASENGSANYWVRGTGNPYINDYFTTAARVYDAGQTWGYYYDGSNTNGSFFSGQQAGLVVHRQAQPVTDVPTFTFDVWPFVDAGADNDITAADGITYSGIYAFGGSYNGITGVGKLDVGVRGIAMQANGGTNASWPVSGVLGEVFGTGNGFDYGQQGVFGWQTTAAGAANYCAGTYGVTSQTGTMSGGVVGQYFAVVDDPNDGFVATAGNVASNYWGALGYGNTTTGVYGYGRSTGALARAVQGEVSCASGNPSYSYGGYFNSTGTQDARAVYATYSGGVTNYAGYFAGNHLITGTKSTAFLNAEGKPVLMYCNESPEVWFEDFGSGVIQNGQVKISYPADIMAGIVINKQHPAKVFVTPTDNLGNYWVEKLDDGFILHAPNAANGATFDWRMAAKRKGYEDRRLDYAGADVAHDPFVKNPYNNPSHDSKVDWKKDLELKTPSLLEELKKREKAANPTPNYPPNSNVKKDKQ